jgi:hypothetical protein
MRLYRLLGPGAAWSLVQSPKMLDGDAKFEKTDACDKDTNESKWPTIFAGGKVENAEDGEDGEEEAKTTSKKLKRLLGGVIAAVSAVLLFK